MTDMNGSNIGRILRNPRVLVLALGLITAAIVLHRSLPHIGANHVVSAIQAAQSYVGQQAAPIETISLSSVESKFAYVSLLTGTGNKTQTNLDINDDNYFVGMRILAYQILHANETRSESGAPFIVLAVKGTPEAKKDRLRRDGATVLEINPIPLPRWLPAASNPAWANIFDKLRMWQLTQFDRLIFVDADVVLVKSLDGAFETTVQKTDNNLAPAGSTLPDEYAFAAGMETAVDHSFPPTLQGGDLERGEYVNAGFMVIKPSLSVFDYYLSVLATPNAFNTEFGEQDLLNHVHRLDGPMPFERLNPIWNIHRPMQSDLDAGVRSVHGKWWNTHHRDLLPYMAHWRWKMEGYFELWDESHKR